MKLLGNLLGADALGLRTVAIGGKSNAAAQELDSVLAAWFKRQACIATLVRPGYCVYGLASHGQEPAALVQAAARDGYYLPAAQ